VFWHQVGTKHDGDEISKHFRPETPFLSEGKQYKRNTQQPVGGDLAAASPNALEHDERAIWLGPSVSTEAA
jgi:hypothetical protein